MTWISVFRSPFGYLLAPSDLRLSSAEARDQRPQLSLSWLTPPISWWAYRILWLVKYANVNFKQMTNSPHCGTLVHHGCHIARVLTRAVDKVNKCSGSGHSPVSVHAIKLFWLGHCTSHWLCAMAGNIGQVLYGTLILPLLYLHDLCPYWIDCWTVASAFDAQPPPGLICWSTTRHWRGFKFFISANYST